MTALYHPELDKTIEVDERKARILRRSGWVDKAEREEAEARYFVAAAGIDAEEKKEEEAFASRYEGNDEEES